MSSENPFSRLSQGFADTLAGFFPDGPPAGLTTALDDLVAQNLARFQLVPREEFDRQVALLERLQGRISALESRLAALESDN